MIINNICVYDYESDSADCNTCEPTQLAALILNGITLEIIPNSEFKIKMRPIDIDEPTYFVDHLDTITWHSNNYKNSPEDIYDMWKKGSEQKAAFDSFNAYLGKYNKNPSRPNRFGAPIRCGHNIRRFDDVITDRLCERHGYLTKGEQKIFNPRTAIDTMDVLFMWLHSNPEVDSLSMDNMRKFFGMELEGGHDALKDVRDTAFLVQKFLKLHRSLSPRIQFKGSYNVKG